MDFRAISSVVSKFAPLLGSAISESSPIAGLILMAIAKTFNSSSDDKELMAAISNDPDAANKLQQLQIEHQNILTQTSYQDRSDARAREEKIIQLTGKRDWVLNSLAMLIVIGFFSLCIINWFVALPDDHIVAMLIGQLSSGFMLVLSYYFGSSNK